MKERLIGAAVLVLIGVLVIPWILDGRGSQQETSATALRLPAPDEPVPVRTETIRVGGQPEAAPQATGSAPVADSIAERQVATAAVAREQEPAPAASPPPAAALSAAAPPRTVADEPAASTPSRAVPPAATPPKPAATASTARPPAKGGWTVQLGSFGDEDNARKLAQRASTYGYKATVSAHKSGGRVMYRVRVGSYDNRAEAGATASGLSAHGITAQVVAAD
ncbi:MAG TPA: SPOR domain-containing protein [Gammaproteobacteria bacterium]|nr:SPOR domain-containing protein [Gammaproteobacteria bacterium]